MTITAHRHRPGNSTWRRGSEVDVAAVLRACRGEQMPLTTAERREAVRRLVAEGLSINAVAERLHVDWRTAQRHRAALLRDGAVSVPPRRPTVRVNRTCRRCNRFRLHSARGLCGSCYVTEFRAGRIEDWQLVGQRPPRPPPPPSPVDPNAPAVPQAIVCDWCGAALTRSRNTGGEPLYEVYTVAGVLVAVCFENCPTDRVLELTEVRSDG
jgi:DNA-binding transcriptional ArsR family regulator